MAMDDFSPVLCESPKGQVKALKRVFGGQEGEKKVFDEGWLQELLRVNPEILPVGKIEQAFDRLITIGREVGLPNTGAIDNLYVNPNGYLTIVETKLWKNPQARREVVAQVIDYASQLTKWNFQRLDDSAKKYFGNKQYFGERANSDKGLREAVKGEIGEQDFNEQVFVDNINRNLEQGKMLLLIVGEGIQENVQDMIRTIQSTPTLHYTLALIELRCYQLHANEDWPLIAVPHVVTRTREIERAIVTIKYEEKKPEVVRERAKPEEEPGKRIRITEEEFFKQLLEREGHEAVEIARRIKEHFEKKKMEIDRRVSSFAILMSDPSGSGVDFQLVGLSAYSVFVGSSLSPWLERAGLDQGIALGLYEKLNQRITGSSVRRRSSDNAIYGVLIRYKSLQPHLQEFLDIVDETILKIEESAKRKIGRST